ncbi:hypothetical protein Hanom_Chr16g01453961 [Helianthus anomalus]
MNKERISFSLFAKQELLSHKFRRFEIGFHPIIQGFIFFICCKTRIVVSHIQKVRNRVPSHNPRSIISRKHEVEFKHFFRQVPTFAEPHKLCNDLCTFLNMCRVTRIGPQFAYKLNPTLFSFERNVPFHV